MSGRKRIKHNDGRSPSQCVTEKRLTPSDIRWREARKVERAKLAAKCLLPRQPNTFRCFIDRLSLEIDKYTGREFFADAIFESPTAQVDLNNAMCMSSSGTPIETRKGRMAVGVEQMEAVAAELISKGWIRL